MISMCDYPQQHKQCETVQKLQAEVKHQDKSGISRRLEDSQ